MEIKEKRCESWACVGLRWKLGFAMEIRVFVQNGVSTVCVRVCAMLLRMMLMMLAYAELCAALSDGDAMRVDADSAKDACKVIDVVR